LQSASSSNNNNDNNNNNNENDKDDTNSKLDWTKISQQATLFRQMALPYYQDSKTGRWLLAGLLALTLLNSGVSVLFSYLSKDFWNALSAKDAQEFYHVLQRYLAALVLGAPVVTYYKFQREQLAVHWREWMTARTITLYTANRVYYNLERQQSNGETMVVDATTTATTVDEDGNESTTTTTAATTTTLPKKIDNPDQRIAEDVNTFTGYSLQLVITILTSLIDLASFSTILWSIYPQLFGAIILYAAIGTFFTAFLGQSLVGLNVFQLQREADLRYVLVRFRDNAESIAFYSGEDLEGQAVQQRIEQVMDNKRDINKVQRNLEFFTNGYRYLIQIVPVAVVAPKYFAGDIALGIISQSVGAFNHILSDLSIIVNQFERLSSFSAGIERLSSFYQAMQLSDATRNSTMPLLGSFDDDDDDDSDDDSVAANGIGNWDNSDTILLQQYASSASAVVDDDKPLDATTNNLWKTPFPNNIVLDIQNLDLFTPDKKRLLVKNLNLQLEEGCHLLIVGNSGAGKSSLLRGIAGLWTVGHGSITQPANDDVYFLPQRPYCTIGSLKDQLLYPSVELPPVTGNSSDANNNEENNQNHQKLLPRAHWLKNSLTDDDLVDILEQVDLLDVAKRAGNGDAKAGLQAVLDWTNVLSLGEQQRLAFGRLLVNQPRLVILDEATSALDMVAEARMYNLLQNMARKTFTGNKSKMANGSKMSPPGLTYISVGHRPSLLAYHDKRLRLAGEQGFELEDIESSKVEFPTTGEISNL